MLCIDLSSDGLLNSYGFVLIDNPLDQGWISEMIIEFYRKLLGYRPQEAKFSDVLRKIKPESTNIAISRFKELVENVSRYATIGALILPAKVTVGRINQLRSWFNRINNDEILYQYMKLLGYKRKATPTKLALIIAYMVSTLNTGKVLLDKELYTCEVVALLKSINSKILVRDGDSQRDGCLQIADFSADFFRLLARNSSIEAGFIVVFKRM